MAAPMFDDLGTHHRDVTTRSPEAQKYFDQGLRLLFAFNQEEAERSFRALVLAQSGDHLARERLADTVALRRALERAAAAQGPARGAQLGVLDKKSAKGGQGWAVAGWGAAGPGGAAEVKGSAPPGSSGSRGGPSLGASSGTLPAGRSESSIRDCRA